MVTQPRLFLLGATCTGKSSVGALVAQKLGGEVISLDSMQVYKGLPILTAQPNKEECALVPHHLVDFLDCNTQFDVFSYTEAALHVLKKLDEKGKPALFVGGTWYYFRALVDGFDDLPAGREEIRQQIVDELGDDSHTLHAELTKLDPLTAQKIHPNDRKKIIRAIEVCRLTGSPMSSLIGNETKGPVENYLAFSLNLPREELYERINQRVDIMMDKGALDEVRAIFERFGDDDKTVHQALGVRQLLPFFKGEKELTECVEQLKGDTRRFAKRQLSFLRREERIETLTVGDYENKEALADHIVSEYEKRCAP